MKKFILILALFISAFIIPQSSLSAQEEDPTVITIYVLDSCPHCQRLKESIETNNLEEVLNIEFIEVSTIENRKLISATADKCKITNLGVPLLYDGTECYEGEVESRDYLFNLANIEPTDLEPSSNDLTPVESEPEEEQPTAEAKERKSLSETLTKEPQPDNDYRYFLLALIPISAFLGIGYFIISKMKV